MMLRVTRLTLPALACIAMLATVLALSATEASATLKEIPFSGAAVNDNLVVAGSAEEVEIRAVGVHAVEGLRHAEKPIETVQYHPEGAPGPLDALAVFDLLMGSDVAPRKEFLVDSAAHLDRTRIDA